MSKWIKAQKHEGHFCDDWVEIEVHLIRARDGVERIYYDDYGWLEDDGETLNPFMWEEGNYSCDCNRARYFARAAGEDEPDDPPCGEERFIVWIVNPANGEVVYDERARTTRS